MMGSIPKHEGKDFAVWRVQIEAVLVAKGLGSAVRESPTAVKEA